MSGKLGGRKAKRKWASSREPGGFVALPWSVIDSAVYRNLSMHARALLIDVARQYKDDNNGRLILTRAHLATLGWKSVDMAELITDGLIFQTVLGRAKGKFWVDARGTQR